MLSIKEHLCNCIFFISFTELWHAKARNVPAQLQSSSVIVAVCGLSSSSRDLIRRRRDQWLCPEGHGVAIKPSFLPLGRLLFTGLRPREKCHGCRLRERKTSTAVGAGRSSSLSRPELRTRSAARGKHARSGVPR